MTDDSGSKPTYVDWQKDLDEQREKNLIEMMERDAEREHRTLADLYRKAKDRGLIKPHAQYQ